MSELDGNTPLVLVTDYFRVDGVNHVLSNFFQFISHLFHHICNCQLVDVGLNMFRFTFNFLKDFLNDLAIGIVHFVFFDTNISRLVRI